MYLETELTGPVMDSLDVRRRWNNSDKSPLFILLSLLETFFPATGISIRKVLLQNNLLMSKDSFVSDP